MKTNVIKLVSVCAIFLIAASCQIATVNLSTDLKEYNVQLYLKEYSPYIIRSIPEYKGGKICLNQIRNDSQNTTNFSYYSKDKKVQYLLSDQADSHIQLIPYFFWNAYQKAFAKAGIEVLTRCENDIPEMWMIFRSFNDEELKLRIHLYKNRAAIFEKEITIVMPPAKDLNPVALRSRAYEMIDLTIQTILNDPGFQAGFL